MIQKHISLPEDHDQQIQQRAKLLKESEERVIQELLEQGLKTATPVSLGESLRQLANLGIKGPKDLSQNIDNCHRTSINISTKKMPENRKTIIFDSSGLTALMNGTDAFHDQALQMSEILTDRASGRVLLPRDIFAETITAISKRVNREAGVKAARAILERRREGDFIFIETDPLVYEKAIALLQNAKGSRGAPSFFDCVVMAFAAQYQTPYIFGFDDVFTKNGYRLPAALKTQQAA